MNLVHFSDIIRILVQRAGRPVGRNQIIDFVEQERGTGVQDEMTGRSLEATFPDCAGNW